MNTILLAIVALGVATPVAAMQATVRVHSIEGAFSTEVTDRNVEPIYTGKLGYIEQVQVPWRTVSPGKWTREIDPELKKSGYSLEASADYDSDGKADTAKIYTNGQQTAVIVTFAAAGKNPLVIFKTDGVAPGMEIRGQGKRFVLSVPEIGYSVLAMHKGKPAVISVGD